MKLFEQLTAGLAITVIGMFMYIKVVVAGLESELAQLNTQLLEVQLEKEGYISALHLQSNEILELKSDVSTAHSEIIKYQNTPPKERIVYKEKIQVIYQTVDQNKSREELDCEDYKTIERNTYQLDWNR